MYTSLAEMPPAIAEKISQRLATRGIKRKPKIYTDTYDSMAIDYGDVIHVDGSYFLITGFEKEGRFGIDEQHKYWVKKALDIESGERRIIKCVFYETFQMSVGKLTVTCYRNPEKEARVLELVKDHDHFMQGYGVEDDTGNLLRILDVIRGKRLDNYIYSKLNSHKQYLTESLPEILPQFLECTKGISYLHANGLKHGDIRRDHILIDSETGLFKWIDFDYDFYLPERPYAMDVFGLGNILLFIVGGKNYRALDVLQDPSMGEEVLNTINTDDLSLLSQDRIYNLKKLFPYIPDQLNNILLHFSQGTPVFYETVDEFYADLKAFTNTL